MNFDLITASSLINNPALKGGVVVSDKNGLYVGLIPYYRLMNLLKATLKGEVLNQRTE
jgi:hypothetical protein